MFIFSNNRIVMNLTKEEFSSVENDRNKICCFQVIKTFILLYKLTLFVLCIQLQKLTS